MPHTVDLGRGMAVFEEEKSLATELTPWPRCNAQVLVMDRSLQTFLFRIYDLEVGISRQHPARWWT